MPPFVEPLDVVVAPQEPISRLELPSQQVQEVTGKVAPPMVDVPHNNVSGTLETWGKG